MAGQVTQGEPGGNRQPGTGPGQPADRQRGQQRQPGERGGATGHDECRVVRTQPQAGHTGGHEEQAKDGPAAGRPWARRALRERLGDRDAGSRPRGPPGGRGGGDHGQQQARADQPPRQAERFDPMPHGGLQPGDRHDPQCGSDHRAEHRSDDAGHGAGGKHDQTDVPFRCPGRGEHAELSHPALSHRDERGRGDQADQEHRQDYQSERVRRGGGPCVAFAGRDGRAGALLIHDDSGRWSHG